MRGKSVWYLGAAIVLVATTASAQLGTPVGTNGLGSPLLAGSAIGAAYSAGSGGGIAANDLGVLGCETTGFDSMSGLRVFWFTTAGVALAAVGSHYVVPLDETGGVPTGGMATLQSAGCTGTAWGWRDLAYDGVALWGSCGASLEEFDPVTQMVTGNTILGVPGVNPQRAVAYRPSTDTFIMGSFAAGIGEVDRNGVLQIGPIVGASGGVYGAAVTTNVNSPSGPPAANGALVSNSASQPAIAKGERLWLFRQAGGAAPTPAISNVRWDEYYLTNPMDPNHLQPTGSFFNGDGTITGAAPNTAGGVAGGACAYAETAGPNSGTWILGGLHQANTDTFQLYEHSPHTRSPASVTNLGGGCPGTAGLPLLTSTVPAEGWRWSLRVVSSAPAPATGVLLIGPAAPLLLPFIVPGPCTLHPSLLGSVTVAGIPLAPNPATTTLINNLVIPIDAAINGATVAAQVFQLDATSPNSIAGLLGAALSDGLSLTVGVQPF
jgi:hypothetical protein